jgi:formamidopyrimidine-DNA glycosylase
VTQLPEVEVLRKELEKDVVGKRVKDVTVKTAGVVGRHRTRPDFVKAVAGHKIESVTRRGTHLVLALDGGTALVVRLGSQGTFSRETATVEPGRYTQVVATFTTGGALHYVDPDKDGELFVVDSGDVLLLPELSTGAIDPLTDTFTWPSFSRQLKARKETLKKLLLDPGFIVGLGDVYSDEILWAAGLSGKRLTSTLSSQEVRRLYRAVQEVLYEAVKQGGTDVPDGSDSDPFDELAQGGYLKVYGRDGQPCARCRQPIVHRKLDSRTASYFCAQCQT